LIYIPYRFTNWKSAPQREFTFSEPDAKGCYTIVFAAD
jgi:hypothetical protein